MSGSEAEERIRGKAEAALREAWYDQAREVLAQDYEQTIGVAGKHVADDIRNNNLAPGDKRTIRAMIAFAQQLSQGIAAAPKPGNQP